MPALQLQFGTPKHGWLTVELRSQQFKLKFDASDVPANPIEQLCDALINILKGIESEVWWNLEPKGYYFEFKRVEEKFMLTITANDGMDENRETKFTLTGDFESIIFPLYQSIEKFASSNFEKKHWPTINPQKMKNLISIIKEQKDSI